MLCKDLEDEHLLISQAISRGCIPSLYKINPVVGLYVSYKTHYYQGNPVVSDANFDSLEDIIKQHDPGNPCLSLVGAPECSCRCPECLGIHGAG